MASREIVIEPGRATDSYWRDLWHCRELLWWMAWRDVLLRYHHASIGFAWAILRPLLAMVIFTFIFGRLAHLPAAGVPYPLLVYAGMLPWQCFATALADAGGSLNGKESIISKVYFPRMIVPAAAVAVSFVDFLAAALVLVALMAWYGVVPDERVLAVPLLLVLLLCCALGAGLWIAMLSVRYKDFRYVIPFMVQMGLYISPVGFHTTFLPPEWRPIYALNPMVGVIDGFRWALLGIASEDLTRSLATSAAVSLTLLLSGIVYFRRSERTLAEWL